MSMEAEASSEVHEIDELVGPVAPPAVYTNEPQPRRINLILDPSAFTRGIGNIKRWYNKDYVTSHLKTGKHEEVQVNLYIPSYTLHEFDYLKKGTSMIATNTRQAVKFIDQLYERNATFTQLVPSFSINLQIESPQEKGPMWGHCQGYQMHSPKVREFPNFKTKFDSSYIGQKFEDFTDLPHEITSSFATSLHNKTNDIQYENSRTYQLAAANADKDAEMPARLKYLISSCIFKRFIQPNDFKNSWEQWKLVSEDAITKIWGQSFGVDCVNVNEAELLIFESYDVHKQYDPNRTFSIDDKTDPNSILQNIVDTTQYEYIKVTNSDTKSTKVSRKQRSEGMQKKSMAESATGDGEQRSQENISNINGEITKVEKFDEINFAPRPKGKLWRA